jgi:hypothetical protein
VTKVQKQKNEKAGLEEELRAAKVRLCLAYQSRLKVKVSYRSNTKRAPPRLFVAPLSFKMARSSSSEMCVALLSLWKAV